MTNDKHQVTSDNLLNIFTIFCLQYFKGNSICVIFTQYLLQLISIFVQYVPNVPKKFLLFAKKGAGQHVEGHSTFTNQTVCQPIGTDVFGEDILLLVDKTGLASKYAGQAVTFDIWPAPFLTLLTRAQGG